ncbi:Uncharacterised protein [Klebsiella quasipneumoniae]|uniref:Uncharacterized protein n=1 Tax=Klebsiella quasipneumoniae TaxID=1463165 RepID=A0ABD7N356_9ENTR|nr:Uncharacterised protein [Klebsiella quasipneumoniae]SSG49265.1 Uncharacterised protein [Klebsiella quasipneumoniae]
MSYLATFSNIVHCGTSHNAKLIEQTGKATGDMLICSGYRSKEQCIELIPELIGVRICVLCCPECSICFNEYREISTHCYFKVVFFTGCNIHYAFLKVSEASAIKPFYHFGFLS